VNRSAALLMAQRAEFGDDERMRQDFLHLKILSSEYKSRFAG
jgi:hypothetical protein